MLDFAAARRMMVDGQVRTADVTDPRLLAALSEIPREAFLPPRKAELAYLDRDIAVGDDEKSPARRMLKPMVLARLIQAAEIGDADRVLDVGCAAGYSTAILSRLAAFVVGLEQDAGLARAAARALAACGVGNAEVAAGPLPAGVPAQGPYDAIVLQGAAETAPETLFGQLKDGGRLVCVLGRGPDGRAMLYRRIEGTVSARPIFDASAPLLPGFERPATFVF